MSDAAAESWWGRVGAVGYLSLGSFFVWFSDTTVNVKCLGVYAQILSW